MSAEDQTLPVKLERLEIESGKGSVSFGDENPFQRRSNGFGGRSSFGSWATRCSCSLSKKGTRKKMTFKRNNGKLLKDPVLKYMNYCCQEGSKPEKLANSVIGVSNKSASFKSQECDTNVQQDFGSLVSSCRQLRISNDRSSSDGEGSSSGSSPNLVACSQQALNPSCDVTIDELASYFETLVHIPKKMSTMAEMMYI